jgi:hypothetical protein
MEGEQVITTQWLSTLTPAMRDAFRTWAESLWMMLGAHGLTLAEGLMDAGRCDGIHTGSTLLLAMEKEGWIERGKLQLHTAARQISAGYKGGSAQPIDYYWMPIRGANSRPLWDIIFPNADAETIERCAAAYGWPAPVVAPAAPVKRRKMVQLPLFAEVSE